MLEILNNKLAEVRKQKEQATARFAELQNEIAQTNKRFNSLCGAEQMILQLIAQVEKEGKGDDSN